MVRILNNIPLCPVCFYHDVNIIYSKHGPARAMRLFFLANDNVDYTVLVFIQCKFHSLNSDNFEKS